MPNPEARESSGADRFLDTKTFVQILGGGVSLYGRNFKQLAPPYVALVVGIELAILGFSSLILDTPSDPSASYVFLTFLIRSLLFHLPAALISGLCVIVLMDHILGVKTGLSAARRRIRPHVSQLLAAGLYASIVSLLGIVFPFVFPSLLLTLMGPPIVVQVIAHERKTLQEAVPRARSLWRRQLLRVFLYLFSIGLGVTLLWIILVQVMQGVLAAADITFSGAGEVLFGLGFLVLLGLSYPLMITMSTLAYIDLRARTEEDFGLKSLERESRLAQ